MGSTLSASGAPSNGMERDLIRDKIGNDLLGGRYRVLRQLGIGGQASIFAAYDVEQSQEVVVKVRFNNSQTRVHRLEREGQLLASLDHPNIIAVDSHSAGKLQYHGLTNGLVFIALERFDGNSLVDLVEEYGPFSLLRALEITYLVCEALETVHEGSIIHRDIKPRNLLLSKGGSLKLIDFGCAGRATEEGDSTQKQLGTPEYLSPEMILENVCEQSGDVFGVGLTLYYLITGQVLIDLPLHFQDKCKRYAPLERSTSNAFDVIKGLGPKSPWFTRSLLKKMLMLNPERRPSLAQVKHRVMCSICLLRALPPWRQREPSLLAQREAKFD